MWCLHVFLNQRLHVYYNGTFPRVIHTRQQCSHVEKVPVQGREGGVFVAEETQLVVEETQEDTGYVKETIFG